MLGKQPDRGVGQLGLTSAFASGLVSAHERNGHLAMVRRVGSRRRVATI